MHPNINKHLPLLTAKESINCVTYHIMKYKSKKNRENRANKQKRKALELPSFNKLV